LVAIRQEKGAQWPKPHARGSKFKFISVDPSNGSLPLFDSDIYDVARA